MDFDEYVVARRPTLVRVAALLGCPEAVGPQLVAEALSDSARSIAREEDPDPDIYRALVAAIRDRRHPGPAAQESLPPEDHLNGPGLEVRRDLAALGHPQRAAVVLLEHADLTLDDAAYALRLPAPDVLEAGRSGARRLGPDARGRLQTAADTVDVPASGPIVPAELPRRWPWVAAAAAVTASVAAFAFTAANSPEPPDDILRADQIPSLFGYDVEHAVILMEARGLRVQATPTAVCETRGKVVATDPPTGADYDEGDTIVLRTAVPTDASCNERSPDRRAAWELIDFATGRGPAPRFSQKVNLIVDSSYPAVLSGEDARNPLRWGRSSALVALREAVTDVRREDGAWLTPRLSAQTRLPPATTCGVPRPPEAGLRSALSISVEIGSGGRGGREDGGAEGCAVTVDVYRTTGNVIDSVVLYTGT